MGKDRKKNRREFIKQSLKAVGGCACAGQLAVLLQSCEYDWELNKPELGITLEYNINEDPDFATLTLGLGVHKSDLRVNDGIPFIIIMTGEQEYVCFSALCTHDSCFGEKLWVYRSAINCECHGSKFDAKDHGKATKGPAERPLKEFHTEFDPETGIISVSF